MLLPLVILKSVQEVKRMKALILNSGMGSRMGVLTSEHPKCMTEISNRETILSRQLKQIAEAGNALICFQAVADPCGKVCAAV